MVGDGLSLSRSSLDLLLRHYILLSTSSTRRAVQPVGGEGGAVQRGGGEGLEADELIVGLPVSADGRETPQSNKVRSVAGRLAVQAAERGLRVYLQDEHGTSIDALDYMISRGVKKSARDVKSDAYAVVMILERYFSSSGQQTKIVLPRQPEKEYAISFQNISRYCLISVMVACNIVVVLLCMGIV
ncbi:uncharacterized protein LOC133928043 [Phragmites australis]|uniref:uncharacterized protein LOC133928043 n=1 Tax=Phragmites australis TaxID=29695 RepID=UPI002D77D43F|nr:uncharacterized protein LOC133928043 [Phragmites australis]